MRSLAQRGSALQGAMDSIHHFQGYSTITPGATKNCAVCVGGAGSKLVARDADFLFHQVVIQLPFLSAFSPYFHRAVSGGKGN